MYGLRLHHPFLFFFGFLFIGGVLWYGLSWLNQPGWKSPQMLEMFEECERISKLPVKVVRKYSERLFRNSEKTHCVHEQVYSFEHERELPPLVRELFLRYKHIRFTHSDGMLDRESIVPSECMEGGWVIGTDCANAELTVTNSSETVYELDGTDPPSDKTFRFPTIYHWFATQGYILYHDKLTNE
jgi:hypothetical protein